MTRIINLTPHNIHVYNVKGEFQTFVASGTVARVSSTQQVLPNIEIKLGEDTCGLGTYTVNQTVWGEVIDLPEPQDGVVYLVSALVLARCTDRPDVVGPDTGPTAVRNEKGQITAVKGFVK